MNGPTHKIGAAAGAAAVAQAGGVGPVGFVLLVSSAYAASCLPDRDRHYEKSWGRRSWTHSVALGLLGSWALLYAVPYQDSLGAPLGSLAYAAALGLAVGWLSHLVLDGLTLEGVPLLLPGAGPTVRLPLTEVTRPATATEWLVRAALAVCFVYGAASWALALAEEEGHPVAIPAAVRAALVSWGGG